MRDRSLVVGRVCAEVERQHQRVLELRADAAEHHLLAPVGGVTLDHDKRAQSRRIDERRAAQFEDELPDAFGHLVEKIVRLLAKVFAGREAKALRSLQHPDGRLRGCHVQWCSTQRERWTRCPVGTATH